MTERQTPIDWQSVLKITNNKPDIAKEIVAMLGAELPAAKKSINTAFSKKQYADLLTHIHKLHGSCCYCGVPKLRKLTEALEKNLKECQYQGLSDKIQKLNQEIDVVLNFMYKQDIIA